MAAQVTPKDTATETPKGTWKVTFLLFLFMLVNFADKIVVGLAGGPIMDELKINPQQFGDLGSSFFYLFSISAIIVKNCSKPRAFSHAAAYLKRNRAITVTTYLADLARQMTQVPKGAAYKTSVFPTFQLAMQQAEAEAPGARAVLTLAALTRLSRTSLLG